jgi:hypothetical protein
MIVKFGRHLAKYRFESRRSLPQVQGDGSDLTLDALYPGHKRAVRPELVEGLPFFFQGKRRRTVLRQAQHERPMFPI